MKMSEKRSVSQIRADLKAANQLYDRLRAEERKLGERRAQIIVEANALRGWGGSGRIKYLERELADALDDEKLAQYPTVEVNLGWWKTVAFSKVTEKRVYYFERTYKGIQERFVPRDKARNIPGGGK